MNANLMNYFERLPDCLGTMTLGQAYCLIGGDRPSEIPLVVWLFENPDSPIALPGKISLRNHDCLHLLLNLGFSLESEAFLLGCTMGSDLKTKKIHVVLFKIVSMLLYPKKYRFRLKQIKQFDLGFNCGRKLPIKNLNQIDFQHHFTQKISQIRAKLSLNIVTNFSHELRA